MTTARFYVPAEALLEGELTLEGAEHHHASRVLRMHNGETVLLLDGLGNVGRGTITGITSARTTLNVKEVSRAREERPRLYLYQAVPHGSKMDLVVQWSVELGAAVLVPFSSARSRKADVSLEKRVQRWRKIALETSRLAGRPFLPEVMEIKSWDEVVRMLDNLGAALLADETGGVRPAQALAEEEPDELGLFIGPEGGFSVEEKESLLAGGAIPVTLGNTILRTETAGMVLLAAVRCHYGLL